MCRGRSACALAPRLPLAAGLFNTRRPAAGSRRGRAHARVRLVPARAGVALARPRLRRPGEREPQQQMRAGAHGGRRCRVRRWVPSKCAIAGATCWTFAHTCWCLAQFNTPAGVRAQLQACWACAWDNRSVAHTHRLHLRRPPARRATGNPHGQVFVFDARSGAQLAALEPQRPGECAVRACGISEDCRCAGATSVDPS